MGVLLQITCDYCGKDITTSPDGTQMFRLRLIAEALRIQGDYVNAVVVRPPIDRDLFFCGIGCLQGWTHTVVT